MATVSTIGFIAGGALLAGGAVMFVAGADDAPAVAVGPGALRLRGAF